MEILGRCQKVFLMVALKSTMIVFHYRDRHVIKSVRVRVGGAKEHYDSVRVYTVRLYRASCY